MGEHKISLLHQHIFIISTLAGYSIPPITNGVDRVSSLRLLWEEGCSNYRQLSGELVKSVPKAPHM